MTVEELGVRMRGRELARWRTYARQRGLPSVRLQWQVALLALVLARVNGNEDNALTDFVVDFDADRKAARRDSAKLSTASQSATVIGALSGAGVYQLGQRKRR